MKEGEVTADLFGFLTSEPNAVVGAIHSKAMPVILTTPAECDTWLSASAVDALALQRPLSDDALIVVARGEKQDPPAWRQHGWGMRWACPQLLTSFVSECVNNSVIV